MVPCIPWERNCARRFGGALAFRNELREIGRSREVNEGKIEGTLEHLRRGEIYLPEDSDPGRQDIGAMAPLPRQSLEVTDFVVADISHQEVAASLTVLRAA